MIEATAPRPVVLLNEAALGRYLQAPRRAESAKVIVAGSGPMSGAATLQGAEHIRTDFRRTRSLGALQGAMRARGGVDDLILAGDGASREAMFSLMCAVLALLPALRRRGGARILLAVQGGGAVASLCAFVERVAPHLANEGILLRLEVTEPGAETR